jgi:hypothetical protein
VEGHLPVGVEREGGFASRRSLHRVTVMMPVSLDLELRVAGIVVGPDAHPRRSGDVQIPWIGGSQWRHIEAGASTTLPFGRVVSSMRAKTSRVSNSQHRRHRGEGQIQQGDWDRARRHCLKDASAGTGQAYCRSPDTIFMRKCNGRPIAPESRSALARTSGA